MKTTIYKASLDKLSIGISFGGGALFLLIILLQAGPSGGESIAAPLISGVLFGGIYVVTYLYHPTAYEVSTDRLIIRRPVSRVIIERSDIQMVKLLQASEMGAVIRTFGVGGLFGYFGKFASNSIGKMTWYATRRDRYVWIKTKEGNNIIVTPDDPKGFCSEFNI